MKLYDSNHLPRHGKFDMYHKRNTDYGIFPTMAVRMSGEFAVNINGEERVFQNCYMVLDRDGCPYCVDLKTFEDEYEKLPDF